MFHKLVWNRVIILHKILLTITYITQTTITNYYKLQLLTMYFWIYQHLKVIIIVVVVVLVGAPVTFEGVWL
jgi:uncharacterized membrane protein